MKKLMIAAGAVAMVAGAFAAPQGDPLVYDYKASATHMYLKEVKVSIKDSSASASQAATEYTVYQKYQRTSNLKGYLIMDEDGATSQAIVANEVRGYNKRTGAVYNWNSIPGTGVDFGRNRGFLVVYNTSLNFISQYDIKESDIQYAKVLPAVLDAKWIDDQFTKAHTATRGPAEGTLYVGGDMVAATRYNLDRFDFLVTNATTAAIYTGIFERGHNLTKPVVEAEDGEVVPTIAVVDDDTVFPDDAFGVLPALPVSAEVAWEEDDETGEYAWVTNATPSAGIASIADYRWTSLHLFGWFNGPNWFDNGYRGPFDNFETVWDLNLPEDLQIGFAYFHPYFHDTWMNGAGFGFWTKDSTKTNPKRCCGRVKKATTTWNAPVLESLAGNLKGGLFICTENGVDAENEDYIFFDYWAGGRGGWEDQFVTARIAPLGVDKMIGYYGTYFSKGDRWQNDMWQDGSLQQETSDVISGTWSIKLNTKFLAENGVYDKLYKAAIKGTAPFKQVERGLVTEADIVNLTSFALAKDEYANFYLKWLPDYAEAAYGLEVLVGTIKAAVYDLSPKAVFINGREISDIPEDYQDDPDMIPYYVPAITPAFASYYGLANWQTFED